MTITARRKAAVAALMLLAAMATWGPNDAWAQSSVLADRGGRNEASCDRGRFRILLDVGHTAAAPGAVSARGLLEYDYNLRLATEIDQALQDASFRQTEVHVTEGKSRPGLSKRVAYANRSASDLLLSIHHDSVPDSFLEKWEYEGETFPFSDRFSGHSVFVSFENAARQLSIRFARLLGLELKTRGLRYATQYTQKFMGRNQHQLVDAEAGVYRYDHLRVLRETAMPAVLLEAGSIINRDEELSLKSSERRAVITGAVVDAVTGFCSNAPRNLTRQARH